MEATWQAAYSDGEQMSALVNGWEKWEPREDLKKGKELLSTNWKIIKINKKGRGRRDDDDDEGWDDNSGYHSDKYDDVEDFPFELDNENLKRVTGLKKLKGEKDTNSEEESEDEVVEYDDDAVGTGNKGGDIVSEEKEEVDERRKSARRK